MFGAFTGGGKSSVKISSASVCAEFDMKKSSGPGVLDLYMARDARAPIPGLKDGEEPDTWMGSVHRELIKAMVAFSWRPANPGQFITGDGTGRASVVSFESFSMRVSELAQWLVPGLSLMFPPTRKGLARCILMECPLSMKARFIGGRREVFDVPEVVSAWQDRVIRDEALVTFGKAKLRTDNGTLPEGPSRVGDVHVAVCGTVEGVPKSMLIGGRNVSPSVVLCLPERPLTYEEMVFAVQTVRVLPPTPSGMYELEVPFAVIRGDFAELDGHLEPMGDLVVPWKSHDDVGNPVAGAVHDQPFFIPLPRGVSAV